MTRARILSFTKHAPLNPEQKRVLTAVGIRQMCSFDRGLTYEDRLPFLYKLTLDLLTEK